MPSSTTATPTPSPLVLSQTSSTLMSWFAPPASSAPVLWRCHWHPAMGSLIGDATAVHFFWSSWSSWETRSATT